MLIALPNALPGRSSDHALGRSLFAGVRGETVWKIAGGVSARLSGAKKRPNWYSLDPSWPLSDTRFGTYPEFPNSFGR
jgi:hypothetical protein